MMTLAEVRVAEARRFLDLPETPLMYEQARRLMNESDTDGLVAFMLSDKKGELAAKALRRYGNDAAPENLSLFTDSEFRAYMEEVDGWPDDDLARRERKRLAVECDRRARAHNAATINFNRRARYYRAT